MAKSASGHPLSSDNYENGGLQVQSRSSHNNAVIETGSSVNALVTSYGNFSLCDVNFYLI